MHTKTMIVYYRDEQGDRTLLYGLGKTFHVIAKPNCPVRRGDMVRYEPAGINFGWYVSTVDPRTLSTATSGNDVRSEDK